MQHYPSYWEKTTFLAPYDIVIVGAGLVGCVTALECCAHRSGFRVAIVERGSLPTGASTRNAGFACFGSASEILADCEAMGEEAAMRLVVRRKAGLERLFAWVDPGRMDYRKSGGYEVFGPEDKETYMVCAAYAEKINNILSSEFGGDVFVQADATMDRMELHGFPHALLNPFEGVLHPGKMMHALHRRVHETGISMFSGFDVQHIEEDAAGVELSDSSGNTIRARYVILATNAFASTMIEGLDMIPARNQVYMTAPIPGLRLDGCFHYDRGYVYFREIDGRVLIGGARNIDFAGEETEEFGLTDKIRDHLHSFLRTHIFPDRAFSIDMSWSGIIGTGTDKSPIVTMTSDRIAVATRLSGMGIALGSLVAKEVANLILSRN